jgi:glyoxylase-like metal-dependent hydrolase (beta-lactamase superfamily II)
MYENLENRVPITATLDPAENLRAMERMRKIAAKESLIVPGHDPEQFKRFSGPMPGIVRIQ